MERPISALKPTLHDFIYISILNVHEHPSWTVIFSDSAHITYKQTWTNWKTAKLNTVQPIGALEVQVVPVMMGNGTMLTFQNWRPYIKFE